MGLMNAFNAPIYEFETIDSTNDYAKNITKDNPQNGTIVISKNQTKGRGRFGNSWASNSLGGIYYSIILKMDSKNINYETLTIFTSIAVSKLFEKYETSPKIKWPNDILLDGKKVCGILCESTKNSYGEFIIIGIGINLLQDQHEFPEELRDIATSLKHYTTLSIDKENFINVLTKHLFEYYNYFLEKPLKDFLPYYKERSYILNKEVIVKLNGAEVVGIVEDFNENGSLILNTNGKILNINSGEVTLKKVYKNSEHN